MENKKVLVVDDSPTQSFRIKIMLEEIGFIVLEANSGKLAIDMALTEKPDVILSDILMPEMDGFELCYLLRSNYGLTQIPVILQSSSYQSTEDRNFGLDIGADAFIPKGFSPEDMASLINQVIINKQNGENESASDERREGKPFDELHAQRMLYKLLEETSMLEKANETIKIERNKAQQYLNVASVMIIAFDCDGKIRMVNQSGRRILGINSDEVIGLDWFKNFVPEYQQFNVRAKFKEILEKKGKEELYSEYQVISKNRGERLIAWHSIALAGDIGKVTGILCSGEDITEQKLAELRLVESEKKYHSLFNNVPVGVFRIDPEGKFLAANPGFIQMLGYQSEEEMRGLNYFDLLFDDDERKKLKKILHEDETIHDLELRLKNKVGQLVVVLNNAKLVYDEDRKLAFYEGTLTNITKNKQFESQLATLYEIEKQRVKHLSALQEITNELVGIRNQQEVLKVVAGRAKELGDYSVCAILKIDKETKEAVLVAKSGFNENFPASESFRIVLPLIKDVINSNSPMFVSREDLLAPEQLKSKLNLDIQSIHAYPIFLEDNITAILVFGSCIVEHPPQWTITLMDLLTQRISVALDNARLFEKINTNLDRLASLRVIDQAISNTQSLDTALSTLLDQVIGQLGAAAADIMLLDKEQEGLHFQYGKGFKKEVSQKNILKIDKCLSGRAVLEKRTIYIPNFGESIDQFKDCLYSNEEGFSSMFCSPILVQGQVQGVMEVFFKEFINPTKDWLEFLETLSGQAAIAVENSDLFTNLQQSNNDLGMAYDETIQGWSRALDLRDKETEGHTKRVTEMTIELAKIMGHEGEEIVHMRRGALLHDIGKMGIPDRILLKPGPLTDEEWKVMRKHPVFAYDLILPIQYLYPALDIPYCHHEKWDGSGYPRGLVGEQIPLSARIFAIVDVWDALTSDRPYRKAWSREKTLAYIQEQEGKHFDPKVVEAFIKKYGSYVG